MTNTTHVTMMIEEIDFQIMMYYIMTNTTYVIIDIEEIDYHEIYSKTISLKFAVIMNIYWWIHVWSL